MSTALPLRSALPSRSSLPSRTTLSARNETKQTTKGLAATVEHHLREYFAAHENGLPSSGLYDRILHEIERPLLAVTLTQCGGNQLRAAALLGLNRNTLRKKIRDLGLDPKTVAKKNKTERGYDDSHD